MRFAVALPWWGYVLTFAAALVLAWFAYARPAVSLARSQRALLIGLRALTLVLILIFLFRPVIFVQATGVRDSLVPILVDVSRSMRMADGGLPFDRAGARRVEEAQGRPRIEQAATLVRDLQLRLGSEFRTELVTFGETVARGDVDRLAAEARRSDLSGALAALVDRYRGRRLAGIVVISDGGDTSGREAGTTLPMSVPVFTVGVGQPRVLRDREVLNLTAGEPVLPDSSVDLSVAATSHGFGTAPIELRLSANGRPIEVRRITPSADGAPVHEVFTVSPSSDTPTVYAVEIPIESGELASENNARRVLVPTQGAKRRVLIVEGAPGFEHTFLKRALARDPGLEIDSVVRKGQNDEGRDTFFVQAGSSRAAALAAGYPAKRAELFAYDAVVFGNIEGDFFNRDQLEMTSEFVAERGGGLLVLGARSFERAGLVGTALEEVLPFDLTGRRSALARVAVQPTPAPNALTLTADGAAHPATRLAVSAEESLKRWAELPPLASVAEVGAPRAGAQVLAVSASPGGELRPAIVTQRYGLGRSMVFAGEASWRWRMMLPASNTSYELAWRQLVRWLAAAAGDPVEIRPTSITLPGMTETVGVLVRTEEFKPIGDADVVIRVKEPGGRERSLTAALSDPREGLYRASVRFDQAGVYTIAADVRRQNATLTTVSRPILVGGADVEMSEPRLNEAVLRRIAETTGGRYIPEAEMPSLPGLLRAADRESLPMEMRDIWHNVWSLLAIVALLATEWVARRRLGLA